MDHGSARPVIYQLLIRTFGNPNLESRSNGSLSENGCGRFSDLNATSLKAIAGLGCNTLWLTGVLEQASGTAYPNRPADDPDLLKGIAGSPYAVKDYFDVCPDYAEDPDRRLEEFRNLVIRCKEAGFRVLMDFIPNHVARSYGSDVRPGLSFGKEDRRTVFFERDNHFYYLQPHHPGGGPPLRLPTRCEDGRDGRFEPEIEFGRVTGNNCVSWCPGRYDWYETVKLNYGHDFTVGNDTSHLPGPDAGWHDVPATWRVMDQVLEYWLGFGVDGFRVDMAHLVPIEFWRWVVRRRRSHAAGVLFVAEAYEGDPAKLCPGNVLDALLDAGFDAVYDSECYDVMRGIYQHGKWANDLDPLTFSGARFHRSLRYAENHDEPRLASPNEWGGHGMMVGKPVSAVLLSLSRGPLLVYHGQEIGEAARGPLGYGGDGSRTSIFDYGPMPEFARWFHGGRCDGGLLNTEQRALRGWYARLLQVLESRAFVNGEFYGLNHANKENPHFGRDSGEEISGHWLYAFLRRDKKSPLAFLVLANFHPHETWTSASVRIPEDAQMFLGRSGDPVWSFQDRLDSCWCGTANRATLALDGLALPALPPLSVLMLEISCPSIDNP